MIMNKERVNCVAKISFVVGDKLKKEIEFLTKKGGYKSKSDFMRRAVTFGLYHGVSAVYQEEHPKRNKMILYLPKEDVNNLYNIIAETNFDVSSVIRIYISSYVDMLECYYS